MSQRHRMMNGKCQLCGVSEKLWLDVPCMPRTTITENTPPDPFNHHRGKTEDNLVDPHTAASMDVLLSGQDNEED